MTTALPTGRGTDPYTHLQTDLGAPELGKDSFIDAELLQHFSDLLYRVKLKRGGAACVYVLFEHKSAPDGWVAFQLLRYLVRIWEAEQRNGAAKLPLILPLVFYHGSERWRVARSFSALLDGHELPELRRYAPEFEYHLCNLSAYGEDELKGQVRLRVWLLLLKHIFSEQLGAKLPEILTLLVQSQEQTALEYLRTVLRYVSAARKITLDELQSALIAALPQEEGGLMQTLAGTWIQQGIERGRQEAVGSLAETWIKQGIEQGRQALASLTVRQLQHRLGILDVETRAQLSASPIERLEQLGEALLDFNTHAELTVWLSKHTAGSNR
jgi:predicted transposase/invertase (TIGR01784 family)